MKIGIIGGGQLGMMMAEEAKRLGHSIVSLDPNPKSSITTYSDCHIAKDYNDREVIEYMNEICDVITYEFENVDLSVLKNYARKIPQKLKALEISRDRIIEKNFAISLGIQTPKFKKVMTKNDILIPSIIKTTNGGYDGKGQFRVLENSDTDQIGEIGSVSYISEELINFEYEISVVSTRDSFNEVVHFPISKNTHKNGILHTSIVDESIPSKIKEKAIKYTTMIINELDYVGTLAVEYFVRGNEVIFNEFAPRPHNSGHYTMDGCNVSQFKNHVLAITGNHIIKPVLKSNTVMINVLGQNQSYYSNSKDFTDAIIHDYFKSSNRENRKIGHINITYQNNEKLQVIIDNIIKE